MTFACAAGRLARTRMCVMIVFHWADVNSVGYRSGWQRLQLMAYNSAPVSFFLCVRFLCVCFRLVRRLGVGQGQAKSNQTRPHQHPFAPRNHSLLFHKYCVRSCYLTIRTRIIAFHRKIALHIFCHLDTIFGITQSFLNANHK